MNPNTAVPMYYQPTPLEAAYAEYLYQTTVVSSPQSSFCISGRDIVPFLSRSQLDRLILRNIWTVADPDNRGSLVDCQQWFMILRLVALCQAGILMPILSSAYASNKNLTPDQAMLLALEQTAGQKVPLAVFEGICIPDAVTLQQQYSNSMQQAQQYGQPSSSFGWGAPTATSGTYPGLAQQQQAPGSMTGPLGTRTSAPAVVPSSAEPSGWDALDALADTQDAPLPALGSAQVSAQVSLAEDEDEFGGFSGATSGTVTTTPTGPSVVETEGGEPSNLHATSSNVSTSAPASEPTGWGALDALGTTLNAPLPALGTATGTDTPPDTTDEDEFGGFADAAGKATTSGDAMEREDITIPVTTTETPEPAGWGALDALATTTDAPLPALGSAPVSAAVSASTSLADDDEEFGGFADATAGTTTTSGAAMTMPEPLPPSEPAGWDALDALATTTDAPLPALSSAPVSAAASAATSLADDDEFGGFADATMGTTTTSGAAIEGGETISGDAIGGDMTLPAPAPLLEPAGWDALDALATTTDAPLPALGSAPVSAAASAATSLADYDDEEFGGFEGPTNTEAAVAPQPPLSGSPPASASTTTGWDALDALATTRDEPLPALGSAPVSASTDDNEFDGFAGATTEENAATETPSAPLSAQEPMGWDALDALASTNDAPLPSLGLAPVSTSTSIDDTDEFGSFADASGAQVAAVNEPDAPTAPEPSGWGALDALASPTNAPIAPLGSALISSTAAPAGASIADDEEFGVFEDAVASTDTPLDPQSISAAEEKGHSTLAPASEPAGWDALDALATTSNAPLPALGGSAPASAEFEDTEVSATKDEPAPGPASEQTGWGALDDLAPATDAPLPSLGQDTAAIDAPSTSMRHDEVFAGSVPNTATSSAVPAPALNATDGTGWDALESLGDVQDAPLPDLEGVSSTTVVQDAYLDGIHGAAENTPIDDDDFGEFSGTEPEQTVETVPSSPPPVVEEASESQTSFGDFAGSIKTVDRTNIISPPVVEDASECQVSFGDFAEGQKMTPSNQPIIEEASESQDKFGDLGTGGETSVTKEDAASAFRQRQPNEPESLGAPSGLSSGKPPLPPTGSRSVSIPPPATVGERSDSGFYSARTSSLGTTSGDTEFDDAVHANVDKLHTSESYASASEPLAPDREQRQQLSNDPVAAVVDDPFSAFDGLSAPAAPLPPLSTFSFDSTERNIAAHTEMALSEESLADYTERIENNVGDLGVEPKETKNVRADAQQDGMSDDEFHSVYSGLGDFDEAPPQDTKVTTDAHELVSDDEFGEFGGFHSVASGIDVEEPEMKERKEDMLVRVEVAGDDVADMKAGPDIEAKEDDFGDFSGFASEDRGPPSHTPDEDELGVQPVQMMEDSFGNFEGASVPVEPISDETRGLEVAEETHQPAEDVGEDLVDFEASFGDFVAVPAASETPADESGPSEDWDAFQGAETPSVDPERENLERLRESIVAQSLQLPEALRVQTGASGSHVEFGDCFDANISLETPLADERKERLQRCQQILSLLSSSHSKMAATYWAQAIEVARDELTMSTFLLEEAAGLSDAEKKLVRQPLETMLHGSGEFIRVVRSIVATIGDLLLLDTSALFTVDTFASSWCSVALLEKALEVEKIWKQVELLGSKVGLTPKQDSAYPLETVVEIRARASSLSSQLCYFTLQPLVTSAATSSKAPVSWQGNSYMACSANFLANKGESFYTIRD